MCRLVEQHGRRMGGQGAVAFGHHAHDANRELAVKFFFEKEAFTRERHYKNCALQKIGSSPKSNPKSPPLGRTL